MLCGVNNCLIYFKCRLPTDEELEKLTPIVLTQGEVAWNPKSDDHNAPIADSFTKEVIDAAKKDAAAEAQENQILNARVLDPQDMEDKAEQIFIGMAKMDLEMKEDLESQDPTIPSDLIPPSPSAAQE